MTKPLRYGIAILSVVASLVVRLGLDPILELRSELLIFALGVLAAARLGGRGPGLAATLLSLPPVWFFLVAPQSATGINLVRDVVGLVVFVAAGAAISLLIPTQQVVLRQAPGPFLWRTLLLGGALVLLAVITRMLYSDFGRERDGQFLITHTYQVLNEFEALNSAVERTETASRAYLLTGEAEFHETYQTALQEEGSAIASLRRLTVDNPGQQARLADIGRLLEERRTSLDRAIPIRRNGKSDVPADFRATDARRLIDKCREMLDAGEAEERGLLAQRSAAGEAQSLRVRWVLGLGSGSLLLLLAIAGGVIERDIRNRESSREGVRRSEERLRLALDSSDAGTWEWDLRTNENIWSEELWKVYGLEPHSCKPSYEAWLNLIHPDDRADAESVVAEAAKNAAELNLEFRICDRDGGVRWLLARGQPLRDALGKPERFIGIALDITRRKLAEEAQRESEAQFRTLANAIPQLCWMANADGWIFWYNDRWYEYTGTTPQQMEGWGWKSVHDPQMLPKVLERWKSSIDTGQPFDMVFPLRGADGVFHPFLTRIVPVRDRDGKIVHWFGTNTDISEQLAIEEALRRALEHRTLAIEAAQLGSWDYRTETGEVIWDQQSCAMFGESRSPIDYARAMSRIHPDDVLGTEDAVRVALAGVNDGLYHHEFRVLWDDGSVHWIASHGRAHRDPAEGQSTPTRFIGVNMDITERKRAEIEILQLNAQLEERVRERTAALENANKELEAFSYSVSHDLRAPLRGIDGWSLAIAEDFSHLLDERGLKYVARVRSETQRMGDLIDDMLKLSRVSSSEMRTAPVDLTKIARTTAGQLAESHPERRLVFDIHPNLTCAGDARMLEIALNNLLSNAVKFTSPREEARIEMGRTGKGKETVFYVRDNGVGFDMKYAGSLFGAFQRLHKASEFPGTGIGLAIVLRVIRRHRGRVWAEAQRNHGATFYFTIEATL
jgi:PAS domain S-box-containing protein